MLSDLKYAIRQLRNSVGFTLTAVLTLGIGIGGVTAVFSVVEAVLLRPLPFPHSAQLVSLHESIEHSKQDLRMTAPDVLIFERQSKAFSGFGGFIASAYEATGAGSPFEAHAERMTASVFPVLGVQPLLGRTFTQREDDSSAAVTVLSYAVWKERFHSDPQVLGRTVDLDRRPYTIVGVMPRDFEFPLDAGRLSQRDLWVPMSFTPVEKNSEGNDFDYGAIARLKPGVSMAQVQQDVDRIMAQIQAQYPASLDFRMHGSFLTLKDETVHSARPLLHILLASVALILLIACVNLANLMLVRAAGRRREFGVRLALGATRRVMLRQLITESLVLSAIGGMLGTALAFLLVQAAIAKLPDSLPRVEEIAVNWPMLLVAALLVGATGLLCGLAPAFESIRTDVIDALRGGTYGSGQGRVQNQVRGALVTVEIALAMVLLMGAGLLLHSFAKMLEVDPGFQPSHVLRASIWLPQRDYPTQPKADAFFAELERRLDAVPGVQATGFSSNIPLIGQRSGRMIAPEGYIKSSAEPWSIASNYLVQARYFEAMRIPLLQGRYLDARDEDPGAPLTAVISQSLANRYFHGKNPIGMHIKVGVTFDSKMPAIAVVGVVGDTKQDSLDQATVPQMYEPLAQAAADLGPMGAMIGVAGYMNVVVRTAGDPVELETSLEKSVHQLDPLLAITNVNTMDEVVAATESSRRFNTVLLASFAGIALQMSLLGIYGVLAYSITERTREIAVRMALGATRAHVLLRTLRYALALAFVGIAAGLIASAALTRFLTSFLYGVKPLDGVTICGTVVILLTCSVTAGWLPARRAASVDPMQVLRNE